MNTVTKLNTHIHTASDRIYVALPTICRNVSKLSSNMVMFVYTYVRAYVVDLLRLLPNS